MVHMVRIDFFAPALLLTAGLLAFQAPKKAGAETKFKAIWEPVNVKEDLKLLSVHFATPDAGWVAGGRGVMNGGVILHTADGGKNWEIQLGDPESSDRAYGHLRVLGPALAFAVQSAPGAHRLLRTEDGKTWIPAGTLPEHRTDYVFVSKDVGFHTYDRQIFRTENGGKTWKSVFACRVKAEIGGLTRDVQCDFARIHFLNSTTGVAISRSLPDKGGNVVARTEDGGNSWKTAVVLPGEAASESDLKLLSPTDAVLRTWNGRLFHSTDGGLTWTGAAGQAEGKPDFEFADPQVGWMIAYQNMHYTTNSGKSWVSRRIGFPAQVQAFCLVSRNRGYAVGDHGMVFRYSVVPVDYSAPGMLSAPMMPPRQ